MTIFLVAAATLKGKVILEATTITALNAQSARDKAVRLLDADVNLDKVKITITPLG